MRRRTRSSGFEDVDAAIAQRSAAPTIVGDEITRIIQEQRGLETRYEELIAQRATSWICSWFSFAFCLFESAFSVARCASRRRSCAET